MDDLHLARAALGGEREAADALARRLRCVPGWLANLDLRAGGILGREDLRDLAQEVLLALWTRLDSYTGEAALESWAHGFCLNAFRNAARKTRRRAGIVRLQASPEHEAAPETSSVLDPGRLQQLLAGLSEDEARAIRLKCFEGLTFEEIGARLAIAPGTAKTFYYRGLRRLSRSLGREGARAHG